MLEYDPKYCYNFTEKEKRDFLKQHLKQQSDLAEYESQLYTLVYSDSKAIFANYDPRAFSKLDVKYTINRLAKNDPTLTHLPFGYGDPVNGNSDAVKIAIAARTNTYCKYYELGGCDFDDAGAMLILDALADKEVEIALCHNPIGDPTFLHAATLMAHPKNKWVKLSFGPIRPSEFIRRRLDANKRISYSIRKPTFLEKVCLLSSSREY